MVSEGCGTCNRDYTLKGEDEYTGCLDDITVLLAKPRKSFVNACRKRYRRRMRQTIVTLLLLLCRMRLNRFDPKRMARSPGVTSVP